MIIKTQKNSNYSVISNICARDINISIKAKGLYFYLMTLPETWTIHREEVYKHFKEGRSSLDSAFNELIELGYIIQKRERNKDGSFMPIEYTVLEDRNEITPHVENPKVIKSHVNNHQQLSNNELSIDKLNTNNTSSDKAEDINFIEVTNTWNEFSEQNNLTKIRAITETRKKKYRTRISEGFILEEIVDKIKNSNFLLGIGDGKWNITFDWLVENDTNWVKVMEDRYSNSNSLDLFGNSTYNIDSEVAQMKKRKELYNE